jgi:RecG-like helicase
VKWLSRLTRSDAEVEADQLQARARTLAATPLREVALGRPVTVAGTIRTVTVRPRTDVTALVAELYDGTGTVTLVWLGQRQLRGLTAGRAVVVNGRVTERNHRRYMFNPRYELRPLGS